jgi:formylglycine-generating enzyme
MKRRDFFKKAMISGLGAAIWPVAYGSQIRQNETVRSFLTLEKATETNSMGMELVEIKPGSFHMGSDKGEYDETPVHRVTISSPFYMGATPVTNAQYEQFDPAHRSLRGKRGISHGDQDAVVFISWHDAKAFTEWLSRKEGKPYRLPTEAEWEYACRSGTTTKFNTGGSLPEAFHLNQTDAWYPRLVPLKVAATPPNSRELYNMHGLVEEWCEDWYGPYPETAQTDPVGYETGDFKVTRGGSHNTEVKFLRSANRMGMLPEDKNCMVGFRVVQAGMPGSEPFGPPAKQLWAADISQAASKWENNIEPYFEYPIYFQKVPPESDGPLYSAHNHCPDITPLPNGDLFATWYTTVEEQGRELAVAAARFRKGAEEWDEPSLFYKVPDRNMHATSIWWDRANKRIYHFQGIGISYGWGRLALLMRTSKDNGVTWSKPHWINREHGLRNMPIAGVIKTSDGSIVVPCDAVTAGHGGTAVHISHDGGKTWYDPGAGKPKPLFEEGETGGWIAGIHAGVVELEDGRLMALGRGDNINGHMPVSLSDDMGKSWTYSASPFPPISSGQRLVLMRLDEGPLFFASFTGPHNDDQGMEFDAKNGKSFRGYGLFAALSYDEGETWPVRKLVTPGEGEYDGGAHTGKFKTDAKHAEPRGYMAATQSPDGIIHLISSKIHYRFNLAWLKEKADI